MAKFEERAEEFFFYFELLMFQKIFVYSVAK